MEKAGKEPDTKIRMMGPAVFGRINLTANRGKYYISTTDGTTQQSPTPLKNIFRKGDKYYVFLVYAKPGARQTYQIYVGAMANLDANAPQNVEAVGANLATKALEFDSICTKLDSSLCENGFPKNWERQYNSATGILTVTMNLGDLGGQFDNAREDICQPHTFCKPSGNTCECVDKNDEDCVNGHICSEWAVKDIDCPVFVVKVDDKEQRFSRCVGFSFTIPQDGDFSADGTDQRPKPSPISSLENCFPIEDWNFSWSCADEKLAGDCGHPPLPTAIGMTQFCEDNTDKMCVRGIGGGGPPPMGGGGEGDEGAVGSCHSLAGAAPVQLGTAMANLLIPLVPAVAVGLEVLRRKKKMGQK
jgi:hypothetical protein